MYYNWKEIRHMPNSFASAASTSSAEYTFPALMESTPFSSVFTNIIFVFFNPTEKYYIRM